MLNSDRELCHAQCPRYSFSAPGIANSAPNAAKAPILSLPKAAEQIVVRRNRKREFSRRRQATQARAQYLRNNRIIDEQAYGLGAPVYDAIIIVAASLFSGILYGFLTPGYRNDTIALVGSGVLAALLFCSFLRFFRASTVGRPILGSLLSWIATCASFLFIVMTMKLAPGPLPGELFCFFLSGAALLPLSRMGIPVLLGRTLRASMLDGDHIIVIGPRDSSALSRLTGELRETVNREPMPIVFDGACSDSAWSREVAKTLSYARRLAHNAGPGKILVVSSGVSPERLEELLSGLSALPRAVCVVPDQTTASLLRHRPSVIGTNIVVEVQSAPLSQANRIIKRVLDVILASCLLIMSAPAMALIAAAIRMDTPGPILFRQIRTGYRGQTFRIFKFRTMTVMENGPVLAQAQKNDVRVTRIGRWLRRSSLDEIPQLLNVLAGDMSLVGPRPHAVAHDASYALQIPNYTLRQHVRPGITGWAQVNGLRGETATMDAMRMRIEHDVWYAKNCSLTLDIRIMVRTFLEVLRARNAY